MIRGLLNCALRALMVVACALSSLPVVPVHAQCEPEVIWHDGGRPIDARIRGDFAFYAYQREVRVFNIANPSAPYVVGRVITPGMLVSMDILGDYLYGATEDMEISVIDVALPSQPHYVGSIPTHSGEPSKEVAVAGSILSVRCSNTVEFFDLTAPDQPVWQGSYTPLQSPRCVGAIPGETHVVTNSGSTSTLERIDVTQPATPTVIQSISFLFDTANSIAARDGLSAIHGQSGVALFERSGGFYFHRSDLPSGMGSSDYDSHVALANNGGQTLLHYQYDKETLWTYDVTNPTAPVFTSTSPLNRFVPLKDIAAKGSLLHVLYGNTIETWDYATSPPVLRHTLLPIPYGPDALASANGGLLIVDNREVWFTDLQDSAHPTSLSYSFSSAATYMKDVATQGALAYTAGNVNFSSARLAVFDASDPRALVLLDEYDDPIVDSFNSIEVRNNIVYCTGEGLLLSIFDATDPTEIVEIGSIRNSAIDGLKVYVHGNAAYVHTSDSRLRLIDISDLNAPNEVGMIPPETQPGTVSSLAMNGPYAYTSASQLADPIEIYDLRDLNQPELISSIVPPADIVHLHLFDSLLMFTYFGSDAGFINVSNPAAPELLPDSFDLTYFDFYNTIRQSVAVNNTIWGLADGTYGVRMPLIPRIASQVSSQVVCGTQQTATFNVDIANPQGSVIRWLYDDAPLQDGIQPNGAIISGASTAELTITNVGPAQVGNYSCRITNLCGQVTTGSAQLSLSTSPIITEQPQTVFACGFQSGSFHAAFAPFTPNTQLRWQSEMSPGVFEDISDIVNVRYAISGSMTDSLTITAINGDSLPNVLERRYRLKVTNTCGTSYTDPAMFNIQLACCDSIDFNNDSSIFDPQDIAAFLSVYSEGPCIPQTATCNDIDFNNDGGYFDPCDILAFLLRYSEGPCTMCSQ